MQDKLLKEIVSSVAGKSAEGIVDLLNNKKNVNEFLIAKKLNLTINQTRNILYRLADEGLVSFIRKKDKKKGGWYTYFWTLNSGKSFTKFRDGLLKEIDNLKSRIHSRHTKRFFYCKNCNIEYGEENALLHEYACPECGEVLELKDSSQELTEMQKQINKYLEIMAFVDSEIGTIHKQEEKVKQRRLRKEKKEKEEERLKKKKLREKLKKKEAKKSGVGKKKGKSAKKKQAKKKKSKKRR